MGRIPNAGRGSLLAVPFISAVFLSTVVRVSPLHGQVEEATFRVPSCGGCVWVKGNTHTHTLESDGDSDPEVVARWYKEHGYDFLVISDHNVLYDPGRLAHLVDSTFLLVPGEEVTSGFQDKPVHLNGLNLHTLVEPREEGTLVGTIQANVDGIRAENGIPHINHPNFGWAFGARELAQVRDYRLLEIFNGHPSVHNPGGGGYPGMEEIWDILLTRGHRIYGIAVDDAHHFQGEFSRDRANPGRGFVVVQVPRLDAGSIMAALEDGRFYASTGVELEDVVVEPKALEVRVKTRGSFRYTTQFIGEGGRVLEIVHGPVARFQLTRFQPYVRARVQDSGGAVAWVQPVFVETK